MPFHPLEEYLLWRGIVQCVTELFEEILVHQLPRPTNGNP